MKVKSKIREASDKSIKDLVAHATKAVKMWQGQSGMTPRVMFKNTCGECGQRGFVEAPNTVPESVQCEQCGNVEPYDRGGYSLAFELMGTQPHGYCANGNAEAFATPKVAKVTKAAPANREMPTKLGCRMNPDQSITPLDSDALAQFLATLKAQEEQRQPVTGGAK